MTVPFVCSIALPFEGCVIESTISVSPSKSVSFANIFIVMLTSSGVVPLSSTASGSCCIISAPSSAANSVGSANEASLRSVVISVSPAVLSPNLPLKASDSGSAAAAVSSNSSSSSAAATASSPAGSVVMACSWPYSASSINASSTSSGFTTLSDAKASESKVSSSKS